MGYCPRTCLVAQLTSLDPNEVSLAERLEHPEYTTDVILGEEYYDTFTGQHESGLWVEDGCVGIYETLTCEWGESISLTDMNIKIVDFDEKVANFCREHNCSYTLNIQASYY